MFHHMTAPFISPNNKAAITAGQARVDEILSMLSMGRPTENATEKEIEEWEAELIKEMDDINGEISKALEFDVRRVGNMTNEQKRELLDIHSEKDRLVVENQKLMESYNKKRNIRKSVQSRIC